MTRRRQPAPIAVRYRASERPVDRVALDTALRELARALVRRLLDGRTEATKTNPSPNGAEP